MNKKIITFPICELRKKSSKEKVPTYRKMFASMGSISESQKKIFMGFFLYTVHTLP